jgi:hypothetical protein
MRRGTRFRAKRGRTSNGHRRWSASDRVRVLARPASHVHRCVPDRRPRTRQSASTIRGGTPNLTSGRADADQAGARPY